MLCVKELAWELKVSPRYVYEMRRCGFAMDGPSKDFTVATVEAAREWIRAKKFRILNGYGFTSESAKPGC